MPAKSKPKVTSRGVAIRCHFDKLVPAGHLRTNPRQCYVHPDEKVNRLRRLIQKAGWRRAVVVSNLSGCIVRGHCATLAALQDADDVPVEFQDFADDREEVAALVADNESAKGSDIEDLKLYGIIEDLGGLEADPDILGMDAGTFAEILETLNPDEKRPRARKSGRNYTIEFDDPEQREAFAAWLNRLKAEMADVPTVGARIIASINRTEGDE